MKAEVKVSGSTVGTLVASLGLALLNAVAADSTILGGLHPALQFIIVAVLPPLVAFLTGYATPSSTSKVSNHYEG